MIAIHADFLFIPLTNAFKISLSRWNNPIDATMILVRLEFIVYGVRIIEDLNFFAYIGSIPRQWRMDANPIIGSWCKLKFKAQRKVTEGVHRVQITFPTTGRIHVDNTIANLIIRGVSDPIIQIHTIEQCLITMVNFLLGERVGNRINFTDQQVPECEIGTMRLQFNGSLGQHR